MNVHSRLVILILLCVLTMPLAGQSTGPWQITSKDGTSSVAFGFLAQGQAEFITNPATDTITKNLFLRRMRLIAGGKISDKISFFIETDSPNLGKTQADGTKNAERMFLQDVILTYKFRDEFSIDGGLLLVPGSHNGGQGAVNLLPVDYGNYSFQTSTPTDSRVGRDYGIQLRGYLFNKHLEYRAGVFQGRRNVGSTAPLRYSTRVVWYPFEAETGFFYSGTNLGKRKILALGFGTDNQDNFHSQSVDVYFDYPVFKGDGVTMQADYTHNDGGTTFPSLPPQHVWLTEAGYYFNKVKLGPFVQLTGLRYADHASNNQSKYQGGLAWWPQGHRFNIKLGIGRMKAGANPSQIQVALQTQFFIY